MDKTTHREYNAFMPAKNEAFFVRLSMELN